MEAESAACQGIIERLSMPGYPGVYWIGRRALRLTFLSQQQRALNLVWALYSTGRLTPATQIVVVGAGLAGLTAAFCAKSLGASVTLIEKKPVPLHLQRGCQLRFVHPHILDWPARISEDPLTDLPCLNWGAGMAARVSNTVLEQWKEIAPEIDEHYGYEVREIRTSVDGKQPLVIGEGGSNNIEKICDIVILGVGFGLERSLAPVPFLSYWENDNLGRPLITEPIPRRYLVTGCGDGGLIDAIRLRVNAFDHSDFVYQLSSLKNLEEIKNRLVEIDRSVSKQLVDDQEIQGRINGQLTNLNRTFGVSFDEAKARQRLEIEAEGQLLEQEYRRLEIPAELRKLLTRDLRNDTIVFLNSPSASPLNLRSSILNRFVVFLLRQYGGLRYRAGEVRINPTAVDRAYHVLFQHDQFPVEELEVHEVVVRHGPNPVISRLFPRHIVEACRPRPEDWEDPTREQQYPPSFLSRADLVVRKERVRLEYAIFNSPLAARENFDPAQHDRFGIEATQGEVSYVLRPISDGALSAERQAPSFYGIPFRFDSPIERSHEQLTPRRSFGRLACGIGIQNIGLPGSALNGNSHFGTLGCFVLLKSTKELALLTTAHSLGNLRNLQKGDRIVRVGESKFPSAQIVATVTELLLPTPSSPQSSIAAGTVRFNHFDGALATLLPGIDISVGFGNAFPDAPPLSDPRSKDLELENLIGAEVFKVGAASGLTKGRIEKIQATHRFPAWGDQYWFEGLFSVISLDAQPFSKPGDGGALVVRRDGTVLGLVMGGGGGSRITHACLIGPMFSKFGCELYTESADGSSVKTDS